MDTVIYADHISGQYCNRENCIIGQNSRIENTVIGDEVEVQSSTIIDSSIDDYTVIGPYAHLRLNSNIGKHVKIGGFVEVKIQE